MTAVVLSLAAFAGAQQLDFELPEPEPPQPVIGELVVEGGRTLTSDTVAYYLGLEPGDELDEEAVQAGFRQLWDSGLFETIRIESEPLEDGTVRLVVVVEERPIVTAVVFEGNDDLSNSDLKAGLDERGIEVPRNVPLRMAQIGRIEAALDEIYTESGFRSATVSSRLEETGGAGIRVVIDVEEGSKVKIADIDFLGNEAFPDWRLQFALKETKEKTFYRFFGKKIIFDEESWETDADLLRTFYLNHGYKDVKVGEPRTELVAKNPDAADLEDRKYRLHVTVPIEEGEPYRLGELRITGNEVIKGDFLTSLFEVEPGGRYRHKAIEKGMETVRDVYHNQGYIYAYTNQTWENRPEEDHVVDVVVDIFEGDRYRLGRLEFDGNTTTRDNVLRREFLLSEGDWMSMGRFRQSVFKVNALGYFKLTDDPVSFDFDDEEKVVDVVLEGSEVGRNDVQFGAGYSEREGTFLQAQFNTRNFMGRGESIGFSLQTGERANYYTISYSDPYFLDRRIMLGGSIFSTTIDYPEVDYYQEREGATLSLGYGLGPFDSISTTYSFTDVLSRYAVDRQGFPGTPTDGHFPPIGLPGLEPPDDSGRATEEIGGTIGAMTPAYVWDSRDDPFDPNRGLRFTVRPRIGGIAFGGEYDFVRPEITTSWFRSLTKKQVFAVNMEAGQFFEIDDSFLPRWERYRLGGERSLRGTRNYDVWPRTEDGEFFYTPRGARLGGDRYWVLNLEYQFRLGGPVKLIAFTDLGNTYHESQGWDFGLYRHTTGAELRVFIPMFQAPLRFIYGINLDPFEDEQSSDFQFSVGTTF